MSAKQILGRPPPADLKTPENLEPSFGSFEFDVHTGLTHWTTEFKLLCGLGFKDELRLDESGLPLVFHPEDRALARERFWAAASPQGPGSLSVELRVVRADGATRWMLLLGHTFSDGGRQRLNGVILDISERKRIEQTHAKLLREQAVLADFSLRARDATDIATVCEAATAVLVKSMDVTFSNILELLPDGETFLLRAGSGWPPSCVGTVRVPASPATPAGLALQLRQHVILDDIHLDPGIELPSYMRDAGVVSSMAAIISSGEPPFGILGVDTTVRHTFTESDLQFLQSIANVLAAAIARIRSEQSWRRENRLTTAALNTSTTLIAVVDRIGRIVRFSPACEKLSGYTAAEALGQHVSKFIPPEEREDVLGVITGVSDGRNERVVYNENHWLTRSGERRLIAWANTVLRDPDGNAEYVIGTGLDITERKRLEREVLAIAEREQRHIGQDLHDDLGQRLAAIQFLSSNLQQDLSDAPPAVTELAGRIADMTREANEHARMLARGLCPALPDGAGLVEALRKLAQNTRDVFRIPCECRAEPISSPVAVDAALHIYRIAQEAVSNAVRHAGAKQIVIEVFLNHRCELRVTDDGIGFTPGDVEGGGMGLRSIRYRASLFQGRVQIVSQPGQGTRLICELPRWISRQGH